MDENSILDQLEELVERLGVQIRHDAVKQDENSVNVIGGCACWRESTSSSSIPRLRSGRKLGFRNSAETARLRPDLYPTRSQGVIGKDARPETARLEETRTENVIPKCDNPLLALLTR